MTNETNPYAPPSVVETEAPSGRYWYTDGISVVAKHGATLPKVDLETGEWDQSLQAVRHVHHSNTQLLRAMLILPAIIVATSDWNIIPGWVFVVGVFLILRLFPGRSTRPLIVWSFTESNRAKRRKYLRIAMTFTGLSPAACSFLLVSLDLDSADWVLPLFSASIVVFFLLAAWALFDRSRLKIESALPGWLRITPLHPGALAFLRDLEETTPSATTPAKKRRIRTAYFHRYPLRILIGHHLRNPLLVFNITLLKLLRSLSLVREVWHYSEAEKVPLENLCSPLRDATASWLADHPGWTFVTAERLPSPAGDLVTESAVLTSPSFDHCMILSRSWMEQRANKGITTMSFQTWLADGALVRTHDHPHLASHDPLVIHHRASGPPDRVYQTHLRHLDERPLLPAADLPDLLARLERDKEQTDQALTKRGILGEVREIAAFSHPS